MNAAQLKASILQLAVQGRLVEQDPNDEPASALLDRIRAEKDRLIAEGKIKKEKTPSRIYRGDDGHFYEQIGDAAPKCIDDELPFEIPESWEWVRLGNICKIINGFTPLKSRQDFWEHQDIAWFTVKDIHNQGRRITKTEQSIDKRALADNSGRILPPNTVLLCCTASVGEYAISNIHLTTNQQFNGLVINSWWKEYFLSDFLFAIAPIFKSWLLQIAGQTTINYVSVAKTAQLLIPFMPLAEQHRIVAKIDELLPLVADFDKTERELSALEKDFPDALKKSILQDAVQGRLVPQDASDEPASALLERIREEKERLIAEGKIKREKTPSRIYRGDDGHFYEQIGDAEPKCIDDELPFEIPETWEWVRLSEIVSVISDGTHKTPRYVDKGIPFLSVQNISKGWFDLSKIKYISEEEHKQLTKRVKPQRDDILICRIGTLGKAIRCTLDFEFSIFVSLGLIRLVIKDIIDYIVLSINSPMTWNWIQEHKVGGGTHTFKINLNAMEMMLFPLPPLAEQHRIVAKIDELMGMVGEMRGSNAMQGS